MSTTTTNFNIILPEGVDTFNPLIFNNDAFTLIDSIMRNIKNATVGTANHIMSEGVNTITRTDVNTATFIFVATSDYESSQTFFVDGVPATLKYSDGSAPSSGAYKTNNAVLCHLNGNILTLLSNRKNTASDISFMDTNVAESLSDSASKITSINDLLGQTHNNYFELPGGLKICWGRNIDTSNINGYFRSANVSFPVNFVTTPTVIACSDTSLGNTLTETRITCKVNTASQTGCVIKVGESSGSIASTNVKVGYIAIGY